MSFAEPDPGYEDDWSEDGTWPKDWPDMPDNGPDDQPWALGEDELERW